MRDLVQQLLINGQGRFEAAVRVEAKKSA